MKEITPLTLTLFFRVDNFVTKYDPDYKKEISVNSPITINLENWPELKDKFLKQRIRRSSHLDTRISLDVEKQRIDGFAEAVKAWNSPGRNQAKNLYSLLVKYYNEMLANVDPDKLQMTVNEITPLIFDETILTNLHRDTNGILFDPVDINTFENWFRVDPIGQPTFKTNKLSDFCRELRDIYEKRNIELVPNFAEWTKKLGIKNYQVLSSRKAPN